VNIKKTIREELEGFKDSSQEDWEWTENSNIPYDNVDTKEDYLNIWPELTEAFALCTDNLYTDDLEGAVYSNDGDGLMWVDVYSPSKPHIAIYIDIELTYVEETDEQWVNFKILDTNDDDHGELISESSYSYVRFTLKPIIDIIKDYYGC
jgi:hypothetical protein